MQLRRSRIALAIVMSVSMLIALSGCSTATREAVEPKTDLQIGIFSGQLHKTEPDDIAQILAINRWKFTLQRDSEQEIGLKATLSIISPDQPTQVIDELRIFTTDEDIAGMVAIYPLGDSMFNAEQIRIYVQLGGGSTSSVMPNPFKEFSSSYTANPADVLDEGNLRLMAFSDNEPMPGPDNTTLSLQLETFSE